MADNDLNADGEVTLADLEIAILDSAIEGVSSVSTDGLTVTEQSLADRLKVLDRTTSATSAALDHFGIRNRQLRSGAGGFP